MPIPFITTKSPKFHAWIRENFNEDPSELKPQQLHNKFIVYLAWRRAEHKQPPKIQEKHQQYHSDTN